MRYFSRHRFGCSFDGARPLNYKKLLEPGKLSVIDLSDSGMSELNNIVIADLLRGVQDAQDDLYQNYERTKKDNQQAATPNGALIIIEEAHEFMSEDRVDKMKTLFEQVARIAKRGRKRRLGLVFVGRIDVTECSTCRQFTGPVSSFQW